MLNESESEASLTAFQCKHNRSVVILSTHHRDVPIPELDNPQNKPDTILFHNKNKVAVDVVDQLSRLYSTKAGSRRWSIFYNVELCNFTAHPRKTSPRAVICSNQHEGVLRRLVGHDIAAALPLTMFDSSRPLLPCRDASDKGIGAVLSRDATQKEIMWCFLAL